MSWCANKLNLYAVVVLLTCQLLSFASFGSEASFAERAEAIAQLKKSAPEQALANLDKLTPELSSVDIHNQINYFNIKAQIYQDLGLYKQSMAAAEQGLELAKVIKSPSTIMSELFYTLGFANESLGDLELAEQHYLEGLEIAKSLEQQKQIALGLVNLGAIYYQTSQEDRSIIALQDALKISFLVKDDELSGTIYSELGILYGQLRDYKKAIEFYEKSFEHFIKIESYISAYNNMRNLGVNYSNVGNYDKSIESYQKIIENKVFIKNTEIILSAYSGLALGYARKDGDESDEKAYQYLQEAEGLINEIESSTLKLRYLVDRAWVLDAIKKYDEALDDLSKAQTLIDSGNYNQQIVNALRIKVLQALIHYDLGLFEKGYDLLDQYHALELDYRNARRTERVTVLRLTYESDQVDLENQILENQARIETIELAQAQRNAKERERFIMYSALLLMIFSWALYRIYRKQKSLREANRTDELTGISNRRHLLKMASWHIQHTRDKKQPIAVLIADYNAFKQYNNQFGYDAGDKALQLFAEKGQQVFSESQPFGRIVDDKFMAILPNMESNQVEQLAQRLKDDIESAQNKALSISIGISHLSSEDEAEIVHFLKRANAALCRDKKQGGDSLCV